MDKTLVMQDENLQKAIEVLQLKFEDPTKSIKELCEDTGITRKTYYAKLDEGKLIIETLRNLITKSKRIQLATIAVGKHEILDRMIKEALDSNNLDELVKVNKYLDEHAENLQDDLGAKPGLEDDAQDFLKKGPSIEKQESKFASIRIGKDEDGEPTIDIYKQHDVLDGEFEDV